MELTFTNSGPNELSAYEETYASLARKILAYLSIPSEYIVEVNIVDDQEIQDINRSYRGFDKPTDVISFAFLDHIEREVTIRGDVPRMLGEILISYETAKRQAQAYGHSLDREMKFLFTHGMLHLLGYDHTSEQLEKEMFALQDKILDKENKNG